MNTIVAIVLDDKVYAVPAAVRWTARGQHQKRIITALAALAGARKSLLRPVHKLLGVRAGEPSDG